MLILCLVIYFLKEFFTIIIYKKMQGIKAYLKRLETYRNITTVTSQTRAMFRFLELTSRDGKQGF